MVIVIKRYKNIEGNKMSYCSKCGNKVEKNMAFCSKCGAPLKSVDATTVPIQNRQEEKAQGN